MARAGSSVAIAALALALAAACQVGGAGGGGGGDGAADGGAGSGDGGPGGAPIASAGPDREVLGGMTVPLDGSGSTGAGAAAWEQTGGPALDIADASALVASVKVPAAAEPGTVYRFRLSVGRADGPLEATDEVAIAVRAPAFDGFLVGLPEAQLGTTEGLALAGDALWVVSTEGFASSFSASGAFGERHELPGRPVGANLDGGGALVVADADDQAIERVDLATGELAAVSDALAGGGALGTVNYPLPDRDGNVYVSTRQSQTVLRYDAASGQTRVFWSAAAGDNPNALAFGPEEDVLYVGLVGRVVRIAIEPDGTSGAVETYVEVGSPGGITYEIDGLTFDAGGNLWIGCPNARTLLVAPYRAQGPTAVSRTFTEVADAVPYFVNLRHGAGAFGETTLYWTNLGQASVGRLEIGLPALVPPLAP